jgi:hypothetical protein
MYTKKINNIAHNIAHHAASGISYLHPHLGEACRAADCTLVALDLLSGIYPLGFPVSKPLSLATKELLNKFDEMLEAAAASKEEIKTATLYFQFSPWRKDDYGCVVKSFFILTSGRELSHVIEQAA